MFFALFAVCEVKARVCKLGPNASEKEVMACSEKLENALGNFLH